MNLDSTIERTLAYHRRTKHHEHQYARSLGLSRLGDAARILSALTPVRRISN